MSEFPIRSCVLRYKQAWCQCENLGLHLVHAWYGTCRNSV